MMQSGYPFQFVGISTIGADKYLQDTLVYAFRSEKSGHQYQVHIERYVEHLCGVKFYPLSSFFFIGAADSRDRSSATTRRHRVYATFVHNLGLDDIFRTFELKDSSMSVLVNRKAVPDMDAYMNHIIEFIAD